MIATTQGEAFYRGPLAATMVAHAQSAGGGHTLADFAAHEADWVTPLAQDYRGYTVHEIPPNGQGVSALMALAMLGQFDLAHHALRFRRRAASAGRGDETRLCRCLPIRERPAHDAVSGVRRCSIADYIAARARLIDPNRAQDFGPGEPPRGGTVYLCAADADGMMVSLIQSNYMGFGSGVVVPGTGISLQNRGAGFVLQPGHPNQVAGGKRPYHTIIPGFVTRDGRPHAAFGVMGGPIQPPGHVQTLVRLIDYGMNPQAVLDAPRWKVNADGSLDLEASAPPELRAGLIALGHKMESVPDSYMDFGAGQFIVKADDGYVAASDSRRDGHAVGF